MSPLPTLGAPGIYRLPKEPVRTLSPERMDVCAFAGVAERGPARFPLYQPDWLPALDEDERSAVQRRSVAVAVESWAEFERLYGGYQGPGRLPYAVSAFFDNGGVRAWIVRVVSPVSNTQLKDDFAQVELPAITWPGSSGATPLQLLAANPGNWGNALAIRLDFQVSPLPFELATLTELEVDPSITVLPGSLVRLRYPAGKVLRFIAGERRTVDGRRLVLFDQPVIATPTSAELVEGRLQVGEQAFDAGRTEDHQQLGFSSTHPRWLAKVLYTESSLLLPPSEWLNEDLTLDPKLAAIDANPKSNAFTGGRDDYDVVKPGDFFGTWIPGDPIQYEGVHCLVDNTEVALICAPDLYEPEPLAPISASPGDDTGTADFEDCVVPDPPAPDLGEQDLPGLRLDPVLDFDTIVGLQQQLVTLADQLHGPIVLLDVPPGLTLSQILKWRSKFDSAFTACYHPWVKVPPQANRSQLITLNPSAIAAGVIAQIERSSGIAFGPANVIAQGVVDLKVKVPRADHDRLHPLGVNVYTWERDGARLSAARTLSRDPDYRQVSVRRLITQLERTLEDQLQWVVFEPNGRKLRSDLTRMITALLSRLYRGGAFTGATEQQAFFVKCDDELNTPQVLDAGQLIAEIGVAPAEPLEFIVLTVAVEGGTISVEG